MNEAKKITNNICEKAKISYPDNVDIILKAVQFCIASHEGQKRKSGEPYYTHPVAVAEILAGIGIDTKSIVTALLHDTVEDTDATLELITQEFGGEVANIVDGVTKITQFDFKSVDEKQANNFRKLILAISQDIRVLLVKLADRLHNMRTLHYVPKEEKRRFKARETMEIYVPLAERVGLAKFKNELENLAFKNLSPEAYELMEGRLSYLEETSKTPIEEIITDLNNLLEEKLPESKTEIIGRKKTPYSIWRKMKKKNIEFSDLTDIIGFRVITDSLENCYSILGILHTNYKTIPGRFKDYISMPKNNGYQSLHTVIVGPNKKRVEIQIRTREMHTIAEMGVAAHWSYKEKREVDNSINELKWIQEIMNINEQTGEASEFLENTKMQMHQDKVFCFTPKGELISLPSNATPVDFAFAVHSEVGRRCVGARINGVIMPLRTTLHNGDQVDIITSEKQTPSPTWEGFVVTGKARSEIRRFARIKEQEEYIKLGRKLIETDFENYGQDYSDEFLEPHLDFFDSIDAEALLFDIGSGAISHKELAKRIFPDIEEEVLAKTNEGELKKMPIKGLIPGFSIHYSKCCHPLPGDRIVGVMKAGEGIYIHNTHCDEVKGEEENIMLLNWDSGSQKEYYVSRIELLTENVAGSLGRVANIISERNCNITNIKVPSRSERFFTMVLDVEVNSLEHLEIVNAHLRNITEVKEVKRL